MSGGSHGGRPSSWVVVAVIFIGFSVGGVAMVIGPAWWLFWVGCAIVVAGGVLGLAVGIFSDVVVDEPRVIPEIVDYSLLGKRGAQRRGGELGETDDKPTRSDTQDTPHG